MQRTPLYPFHLNQGAKMVPFHGWEMPTHYGSQIEEHQQVRTDAGLFDVSHMTIIDLAGDDVTVFLRYLLANDVARLEDEGQALYSPMLNEQAGVIDDLICYRRKEGYRLVVNSATREVDLAWLQTVAADQDVQIVERVDLAMLAVQGPKARQTLAQVLPELDTELAVLKAFHALDTGQQFIARTGYTGEDGVEIMLPIEHALALAEALVEKGVKPCGLGARDTLRLEAGLNLYGSDMDTAISPLACSLAWTIDWRDENRDFIGKSALKTQRDANSQPRQVGLILQGRGVMRADQEIQIEDHSVGVITSGSFSPTLQKSIAFARVERNTGPKCTVAIRGKAIPAVMVKLPFVRNGKILVEDV